MHNTGTVPLIAANKRAFFLTDGIVKYALKRGNSERSLLRRTIVVFIIFFRDICIYIKFI